MRAIRRVGGMAVAGLLLSSFVGGPAASAQTTETSAPETYLGSAAGQALVLKIGGNGISAGNSSASLDSTLKAVAEGIGSLNTGVLPIGGTTPVRAAVTGDNTRDAKALTCATPAVPAPLNTLLAVGAACGSALAEVQNGLPKAVGTGSVMDLDLTANTVLSTPINTLQPVLTPVLGTIDTINKTVDQLAAPVPDLKLDDSLTTLLDALKSTKTLDLRVGDSVSQVVSTGDTVTSTATAAGGVISLLPVSLPLADGTVVVKPIVEIVIGSSRASAVYNRAGGVSSGSFDPAIVTVRINLPTTDELGKVTGINFQEIKVAPNLQALPVAAALAAPCADAPNEICVLAGTPLETRIAIASGRTFTNPDGTVGAVADAVKVHALKNIGTLVSALNGGILLELAHTEAGVGGKPAQFVEVALPEIPRSLPRTGGTPWLPIAGVAGLAMAFLTRRAIVRSH